MTVDEAARDSGFIGDVVDGRPLETEAPEGPLGRVEHEGVGLLGRHAPALGPSRPTRGGSHAAAPSDADPE